jgi:hypothetical protein
MENFVRKLKRGTNKYKGMLPLKCFNCGGVGHFSSKCPHKNKESDEEEDHKKKKKNQKNKRNKNKFSRKVSAPRKTVHHQMRKKTVTMIQKEYSSWK